MVTQDNCGCQCADISLRLFAIRFVENCRDAFGGALSPIGGQAGERVAWWNSGESVGPVEGEETVAIDVEAAGPGSQCGVESGIFGELGAWRIEERGAGRKTFTDDAIAGLGDDEIDGGGQIRVWPGRGAFEDRPVGDRERRGFVGDEVPVGEGGQAGVVEREPPVAEVDQGNAAALRSGRKRLV